MIQIHSMKKLLLLLFLSLGLIGSAYAAQLFLGLMYIHGQGVNQSYTTAAKWVKKSYDNNCPDAEGVWNNYELWKYE